MKSTWNFRSEGNIFPQLRIIRDLPPSTTNSSWDQPWEKREFYVAWKFSPLIILPILQISKCVKYEKMLRTTLSGSFSIVWKEQSLRMSARKNSIFQWIMKLLTVLANGDFPCSVTYICEASMATCSKNRSISNNLPNFNFLIRNFFPWNQLSAVLVRNFSKTDFLSVDIWFRALEKLFIEF